MRYASIRSMDVSNGKGIGVSLFVQGCPFHCNNCFNQETWDFDGGREWTEDSEWHLLAPLDDFHINRCTILGGEPLAEQNVDGVLELVKKIRYVFPDKIIWLYSGFTWEQIMSPITTANIDPVRDNLIQNRKDVVTNVDVFVDGQYIDELKDLSLKWRGSSNQRVIDVKKSLAQQKVVLFCE